MLRKRQRSTFNVEQWSPWDRKVETGRGQTTQAREVQRDHNQLPASSLKADLEQNAVKSLESIPITLMYR
jgi:hypothetical protein